MIDYIYGYFKNVFLWGILCCLGIMFPTVLYPQVNNRTNVLRNSNIIENTSKQIIKVAIVLPLTGDNGPTGQRLKTSISVIERLNESFKYDKQFGLNFTFKVETFDDACNDTVAKKVAQDIINQGDFFFVIGHFCSSTTRIVAPLYEEAGIVQITPFSTDPSLTELGHKTFFRLSGRNDRYGEIAAEWLHEFRNRYKLATIYDDNIYGKSLVDNVVTGLNLRIDNQTKNSDFYYRNSINFSEYALDVPKLVDILIRNDVKMVYYGGYYLNLIKIIAEIKKRNKKMVFFSADSVQSYDFWVESGGLAENVIFTLTKDVTRDISQQELNQINRRKEFYKLQKEQGRDEATRIYGAASRKSIYESNRVYKDRIRFLREYFKKYNEFPDLYMSHLYATFEIIKDIVVAPDLQDIFTDLSIFKTKIDKKQVAANISNYMQDKGFNSGNEYVGFRTILGTVNFSNTGDWVNAEYVIYRWVDRPQNREWLLQESDTEELNFIGKQGDFIRLF